MSKKLLVFTFFVLSACSPQQKPSKSVSQTYNFYNTHLFFDLESELERIPCQIRGEIPPWLSGTLLRNGPAKFQVGDQRVSWFDGLAMLHAFEFTPQQVLYTNRFLRSEQYYRMMKEKSLDFFGFAQDPCPKVFKNQISKFIPKEMLNIRNADVSIQEYADKMVALTEVPLPVVFDPEILSTVGIFNYEDKLPEGQWESAHPQHDLLAGETINYFIRFGEKSSYVIWKMKDHHSKREIIAEIPVQLPAYMHSFALTEHYVILVEFPFVVNPLDLIEKKKPFIFNYKWAPEQGTTFFVVDRNSGALIEKIKEASFFAYHHVNAFDKEGKIFIDMATHPNAESIDLFTESLTKETQIRESQKTKFQRFTITLNSKELSHETLCPESLELPRVRSDRTAHEYRYCYAVDAATQFPASEKGKGLLHKFDVAAKTCKSWSEEGCFPGEPIFVPRPEGQEEDDGVVLSVILDIVNHRSFLLVLDAANWTELAQAEAPHPIPLGIHGLWNRN